MTCIRDQLWLWAHEAGSHDTGWNLPGPSRITPVEAAWYMGIPNLIMVRYGRTTAVPAVRDTVPFRALRRVVWSVVGAGGSTAETERRQVLALADHLPNLSGVMMDDFFRTRSTDPALSALTPDELRQLRAQIAAGPRPLDLWVVLYDYQLDLPIREHLSLCDVVSFWTWKAQDQDGLEANFARAEALAPQARKVLGCYLWDYGARQPMPVAAMARQLEIGRRWLRQGRIAGMIFLASCICDLDLETVEWTRDWIARNGSEPP